MAPHDDVTPDKTAGDQFLSVRIPGRLTHAGFSARFTILKNTTWFFCDPVASTRSIALSGLCDNHYLTLA